MSLTLESCTIGDIYIEYEWDKYAPHYVVFVGRKGSDKIVHTIWNNRYATEDQAKKAYKRQVAKYKKSEGN